MVMVVDLVGQSRSFVRAAVGLSIGEVVGLAISKIVLTEMNVAVGFFGLSLW